jgi:hypothetical protein
MGENLNVSISLGIHDNFEVKSKITNVGEKYNSNLIVYKTPVSVYKECFTN